MYRSVIAAAGLVLLVPASALASTEPPGSEPAGESSAPAEDTANMDPAAGAPATVYDEDGEPQAAITAADPAVAWTGYEEGNEPDEGQEYVRMVVTVESLVTEGSFTVAVGNFVLQNQHGFLTEAQNVPTAEEAESGDEITEEAELASGESVELTLTFPVDATAGPRSVFFRPDDDRLVEVADISQ